MSVLIRDMKKPEKCGVCPMRGYSLCPLTKKEVLWNLLDDDCPLIEVSEDVQTMKWIPVAERLPDFEGMCLCMRKSYSKANFRHQEIMYFDYDGQGFFSNVEGIFVADGNVTHWMPLPKPPEECET